MGHFTFYIIDDDRAARNILTEIIEEENLGEVIGQGADGTGQELAIMQANPQIVLLDLLMPGLDGISLANMLRRQGFNGRIVMISQVEDKNMVARAYQNGVEFYITKPINRIEVISVLRQLLYIHSIQQSLEQALQHHQSISCAAEDNSYPLHCQGSLESLRKKLNHVLFQLGIIGESGANDIIQIVTYLHLKSERDSAGTCSLSNLQNLYGEAICHLKDGREASGEEIKAMEQRLRRTIKNCFDNIAALGLEDYGDPRFERYAGTLFDFKEVRNRMEELRKDIKNSKTKISIKKFIKAIFIEVTTMPGS